jgi:tellurite resistance protein TerC
MLVWIIFIAAILFFLALDLGVFNKTPHIISSKEAGKWTGIFVTLSFLFSGVIYWIYQNNYIENPTNLTPNLAVMKYITGYLIELESISRTDFNPKNPEAFQRIFDRVYLQSAFQIPKIK